jgi:type I restriction-modification system DNA methylase subunit
MDAAKYKHSLLSLNFVKYISDTFTARRAELKDRDYYTADNVFWISDCASRKALRDTLISPHFGPTSAETHSHYPNHNPLITMNTERIEELLEQLIAKQDDIIFRLETLESVVDGKLDESNGQLEASNFKLDSIHEELNWWENKPSLAKQLLSALERIDTSLQNIDTSISMLDR